MGLRFRKSFKFGPFRTTISKSGISSSIGVKGYRVTKTASGKIRTTASIPGTGISYVSESKNSGSSSPSNNPSSHKRGFSLNPISAVILLLIVAAFLSPLFSRSDSSKSKNSANQEQSDVVKDSFPYEGLSDEQRQEIQGLVEGIGVESAVKIFADRSRGDVNVTVWVPAWGDILSAAEPGQAPAEWADILSSAKNISAETHSLIQEYGYNDVSFQISNGDVIFCTIRDDRILYDKFEVESRTEPKNAATSGDYKIPDGDRIVWVSDRGTRYHFDAKCAGSSAYMLTKQDAWDDGYSACQRCVK